MADRVEIELLIKAPSPPEIITVENVAAAHPRPEHIERCRRWLSRQGLECHATDFGIVCRGSREAMEAVFADVDEPVAPSEIAEFVMQVNHRDRSERVHSGIQSRRRTYFRTFGR